MLKTSSRKNVSVSCSEQRALSGDSGLEALSPYTNLLTAAMHFYVKTRRLKTQSTDIGLFGFSTRRPKTLLNRCRSSRYRITRHEFVRSVDSFSGHCVSSIVVPKNFKKPFTISFCLITASTVQLTCESVLPVLIDWTGAQWFFRQSGRSSFLYSTVEQKNIHTYNVPIRTLPCRDAYNTVRDDVEIFAQHNVFVWWYN